MRWRAGAFVSIVGVAACGQLLAIDEEAADARDAGIDGAERETGPPVEDGDTTVDLGDPPPDGGIDVVDDVAKIAFVTSRPYHGTFGGVSQADKSCDDLAWEAGVAPTRRFVALLKGSPSLAALADAGPWYFRNGALALAQPPRFGPDPLVHPATAIVINEFGTLSDAKIAWTAWNGSDCGGWTNAGGTGGTGAATQVDDQWLASGNSVCDGTTSHRFYCFER